MLKVGLCDLIKAKLDFLGLGMYPTCAASTDVPCLHYVLKDIKYVILT